MGLPVEASHLRPRRLGLGERTSSRHGAARRTSSPPVPVADDPMFAGC